MSEITVGRSANNTIVLTDKSISNYHAKFILNNDGQLFVKDLNSTNGTFVNDIKIDSEQALVASDSIKFGDFLYNWQEELLSSGKNSSNEDSKTSLIPDKKEVSKQISTTIQEIEPLKKKADKDKKIAMILTSILVIAGLLVLIMSWFDSNSSNNNVDNDNEINIPEEKKDDPIQKEPDDNTTKKDSKKETKPGDKAYNLECLDDKDGITDITNIGKEIKKTTTELFDAKVSIKEEEKVGQEVKEYVDKTYSYTSDRKYKDRIDKIIIPLLKSLGNTKYKYKWHTIKTTEINAFTAGGYIFVTTAIIDFAKNDDELACIIGHEIYHNELGHIKDKIKEQKIAKNLLGDDLGNLAAMASSILSTPFNQENEAYCDLYGLDLAFKAGYDGCAAAGFWDRMSQKEKQGGQVDKLFRSHPYSKQRSSCVHHHIETNYNERKCKH